MEKVIVTRPMIGICHMQVCCDKDATDQEILDVCNRENVSGTSNGWALVIRKLDADSIFQTPGPVQCADDPNRLHIMVAC